MPLFHVPHRWLPRTAWTNIRHIFSDLTGGVANVIRWIPVIWLDRDYDWCYLAHVMEYKLRRMSKAFENGHHLHRARDARQTLICAELLKRLVTADYYDNADRVFHGKQEHDWAKHISMQEKQDQEYLALMFRKYLRHWWD